MRKNKKRIENNRGKKKLKKQLSIKDRAKIALILIGIFSPLLVYIYFNTQERNELLRNDSFETIAFIEKLKRNSRKGTTTSEDVIYFNFQYNDTIHHEIYSTMTGTISGKKMKIGDAYNLTVVKSNTSIFKLKLESKIDTIYSNSNVKCHKFKSERHKQIIKFKR